MNWQPKSFQWLQRPQTIGLLVGAIVIVGLIAFQTNLLAPPKAQMRELISKCHLRHSDLQRIQVALGESGLNDFQIEGQKLLVPQNRHTEYLQAVSERDALPMDLRETSSDSISNPLLSRSQQQALKWQQKKRQLKEMMLRLPFVQQAWLEIDVAPSSSPFQPARQSAVISIRPEGDRPLDGQHVDTLRRMIGGAVAGLQADQIEVIDLGEGFAYDRAGDSTGGFDQHSRQQLRARENQLEDQISVALSRFRGVDVDVRLSACPDSFSCKAQLVAESVVPEPSVVSVAPKPVKRLTAGSNGAASIYDEQPSQINQPDDSGVPVRQISHSKQIAATCDVQSGAPCRVSVQVDVPESALANVAMSLMHQRHSLSSGSQEVDRVEQKFRSVRPQIQREVASMLPADWLKASGASPIEVTLRRSAVSPVADSSMQFSQLFEKYWPAVATLGVAMLLLSLVIRKPNFDGAADTSGGKVLSMSDHRDSGSDAAKNAKERINRMFRDDPDKAAAAIEGWIKKAG